MEAWLLNIRSHQPEVVVLLTCPAESLRRAGHHHILGKICRQPLNWRKIAGALRLLPELPLNRVSRE